MEDLLSKKAKTANTYTAQDIEVLEGLEPVRRRPGMYIGGTDDRALHHLVIELIDNAMDEAVAGHASRIEMELLPDGGIRVSDNGRGIPIDPHPKFPEQSALEVILTTLHSGGKFSDKAYQTSGGLHGVGVSVVNALSSKLIVEVARDREIFRQEYAYGVPQTKLEKIGEANNRRGTTIIFYPDMDIFDKGLKFRPSQLYRMCRSKAYLYHGVMIRWYCAPELLPSDGKIPQEEQIHFPGGLRDFLVETLGDTPVVTPQPFVGEVEFADDSGKAEWAIAWPATEDESFFHSYCNTIPTPLGGTHEAGFRSAIVKGLKGFADLIGNKKAGQITSDDALQGIIGILSIFIKDPQFQGQTKDKLASAHASRLVENVMKDHFDHWLSGNRQAAEALLDFVIERAEDRLRRKNIKETARKTVTKRLRLPGKLSDCSSSDTENSEIFLVEGESAGGTARQARSRETQAILPLRGKILNVASTSIDKMLANQEINDLVTALGCGYGKDCSVDKLRYGRIIIMTDADVDGAHIAALLMTYFYQQMRPIVKAGKVFLAQPPLYRLTHGSTSVYVRDDEDRDLHLSTTFKGKKNVEIGRFKGLGEMPWRQLQETTMSPKNRMLLRVCLPDPGSEEEDMFSKGNIEQFVDDLMGRKPEKRFAFIQENAQFAGDLDI